MLVYLSGPMTGHEGYNYPAFEEAAAHLRANGHDVLNPAETAGGVTHLPRETFMLLDVGYVEAADAVVVMEGWQKSKGAKLEMILADSLGKPVYKYSENTGLGRRILPTDWTVEFKVREPQGTYSGDNETAWSPEMREVV